jgi:GNAT superfamily N-acetyltransferase
MPTIHATSPHHTPAVIRPMRQEDLVQVLRIQRACYAAAFHEGREAFLSKLIASPSSNWVTSAGDHVYAYLVSLPVDQDTPPALHADSWHQAVQPTMLYLHDMAIDPASRGAGLSHALLNTAQNHARDRGLRHLGLIAVQESVCFWRKHGFEPVDVPGPAMAGKLATFGADAIYMVQTLP